MYLSSDVGHLSVEWAIDEVIPGRHPFCAACKFKLQTKDERIVLRKEQANSQGIREGIFLCGPCAWKIVLALQWLLEEK